MAVATNSLAVVPWAPETVLEGLGRGTQAHYLVDYVERLAEIEGWWPITIAIEGHYVDRHYLDDFQHYYARSFHTPESSCRRWHFFGRMKPAELEASLHASFADPSRIPETSAALQNRYLGFLVQRPLSGAPVGRTVLRTYPVDGRRHYCVVRPYTVHVAGHRLRIDGLAYQQQDRGAAVCASTALWSALQRVAYVTGQRTPTPSAITRASGSPFPTSAGLDVRQMAEAISRLGYGVDAFYPRHNRALFRSHVVAYLDSNLPVILMMTRKRPGSGGQIVDGHAIVVTGYSEPRPATTVATDMPGVPPIALHGSDADVLYVHDDNLGSHARYELYSSHEWEDGFLKLEVLRGRSNAPQVPWWRQDVWSVFAAIVAKPPKLRKGVEQSFHDTVALRPLVQRFFPIDFVYARRFTSGTEYQRVLLESDRVDRSSLPDLMLATRFSRQIGVIRALRRADTPTLDIVVDATEVERDPILPRVTAIVAHGIPANSPGGPRARQLAEFLGCPLVLGKRLAETPEGA
jgi:Peptidase_C39 like family